MAHALCRVSELSQSAHDFRHQRDERNPFSGRIVDELCTMLGLTRDERSGGVFELIVNLLGELQMERGLLVRFQANGVEGVSKLASNEETTVRRGGILGMSAAAIHTPLTQMINTISDCAADGGSPDGNGVPR